MSVLISVSQNRRRKLLPGKFLFVFALAATVLAFLVMYRAGQRLPLPKVQDIAMLSLIASGTVSALIFFILRRIASADFQSRLMAEFFEQVEDPIYFVNKFSRPVLMNLAGQKFIQRMEDSVIEQLAERLLKEDTEGAKNLLRLAEAVSALQPAEADVMILNQYEEVQRLLVSVKPLPEQGLVILRLIDLSLRNPNLASSQHGLSKLIQILDHVPIGLYAVDDHGKIVAINWTLAEWLKSTPAQLISNSADIDSYIVSKKSQLPGTPLPGQEDVGQVAEEVAFKNLEGQIFHAFLGRVTIGQEQGQLKGGLVLREDAADGDWQVALRRSKLLFKRFFEEAPVGIVLLDLDGHVTESNRLVRDLMGRDIIGELMSECIEAEDKPALARKMAEAISLGDTAEPIEVRLKSTPQVTVSLYVGRMEDDQETAFGMMLHFIDVTEQKSLEQQFVQSQKMQAVGQLAGGVAHDFNNLLTAMIGYCDLLLMRYKPGDPSFADINQIKQNANRAAGLVRQLLAFSRQQRMSPKVLRLTDALAELSNLITRLIGENIILNIEHDRDLWLVKVDHGQFEQVVINLAVNARDAMEGEGTLTIRTENVETAKPMQRGAEVMPPGEYVKIAVSDTGCGIPENIINRIFEPFFSTKEVGSGTGLGLSTVYGIMKQTNGFVFVDSVVGQGTTFNLYIPRHVPVEGASPEVAAISALSDKARAALPEGAEAVVEEDLTGAAVILFAEDEDPVRMFTTRALENKGYKVMAGSSGEQALELFRTYGKPVDLLITDVMMPGMDGPTLIDHVRKIQPEVKVLCISGYSEEALRDRISDDRGVHFLPKPFNLKEIATTVKRILNPESAPDIKPAAPASSPPPAAPKPVAPKPPETPPPAPASDSQDESAFKAVIMYAEDEEPVRAFTTRALSAKGYKIIEAASGEQALEIMNARGKPIDLLITDVMMPGIDGPTLINKMRKIQPELRVICVSGYSEDRVRDKVDSTEDVHFLPKPFSLKDIAAKVEDVLAG